MTQLYELTMKSNHGAWLRVKTRVHIIINYDKVNQSTTTTSELTSLFPVYDLTRISIVRTVFRGDLFVLAVASDDKLVLFRDRTLKKRHGSELVEEHI